MQIIKKEIQNFSLHTSGTERTMLLQDCAAIFQQQRFSLGKLLRIMRTKNESSYFSLIKEALVPKIKKVFACVSFVDHSLVQEKMTQSIRQRQALYDLLETQNESVVIYMKIKEFSEMKERYDRELLYLVEEELYRYMQQKKFEVSPLFANLYWLGDGEYAIVFKRSLLNGSLELIVPYIKKFQRMIRNRVLVIANRRHAISLQVSLSDASQMPLQNALSGMDMLDKSGRDFVISNKARYVS